MTSKMETTQTMNEKELRIVRIFDAPREHVWKAWTDPERVKSWWGPKGFTAPFAKTDLRVGGKYLYCMRAPDGKDYWSTGVYREIVPMQRIVATDSFADEKGNVVPATHYGMSPDLPLEFVVTVTFEEYQGKTRLTLTHKGLPLGPDSDMASQGWNQSFDKLVETLKRFSLSAQ
jgi:uncharacterized protein YndB with AHSA1/START domain